MVVGGADPRAASPTQVLSEYRSYSSGGPRPGPLDDSHMRMSVGSFGGQSMAYSRSYGEAGGSPNYYYSGQTRSHEGSDKNPPFYASLRKYKAAFKDCTFLLPGLKAALLEASLSGGNDSSCPSPIAAESGLKEPEWSTSVSRGSHSETMQLVL